MPNHIKIDVDGLEESIIDGMKNLLSSSCLKSILVEITDDSSQIHKAILEKGFFLYGKKETSSNTANYIFKKR